MTVADLSVEELVLFIMFSVAMWDVIKFIGKSIATAFKELVADDFKKEK